MCNEVSTRAQLCRAADVSSQPPPRLTSEHLPAGDPPPLSRSRKRRSFSEEEDELLLKLHALLGNRWSLIAGRLPGRTDKEVMNHWNSKLIKRMDSTTDHPPSLHDDEHRRRRRRLRSEAHDERDVARHPGHNSSSSSKDVNGGECTVADDASSCNQDDNRAVAELNLELTLSTPCIYLLLGEKCKDGSMSSQGLI
uniref:Uncharacterized protein n=1 Tax=Oryza punctata TaxID=4537 RepID=A0A0E0JDK7_ORYPU